MENQRTQQERPGTTKPRQPQRKPASQPGTQKQDNERQRDRRQTNDEE